MIIYYYYWFVVIIIFWNLCSKLSSYNSSLNYQLLELQIDLIYYKLLNNIYIKSMIQNILFSSFLVKGFKVLT